MKSKISISVIVLLFISPLVWAAFPSDLDKGVEKRVAKLFGLDAQFREIPISEKFNNGEALMREGDLVYVIHNTKGVRAYVLSTSAKGRYDYFDYSAIFSEDLSVAGVIVTTYRSSRGAAICSKGWLRQFESYGGEVIRLGKEIDSISGATISATSLVEDIRRSYLLLEKLKSSGRLK